MAKKVSPKTGTEGHIFDPNENFTAQVILLGLTNAHAAKLIENGFRSMDALEGVSRQELQEFSGCLPGEATLALNKLKEKPAASTVSTATTAASFSILPVLPDAASFIEALKTGGILKVDNTDVMAAVKAAFAKKVGLYELPAALLQKVEQFAILQEEPCGKDFFKIQRLVAERKYGDVLAALDVPGSFVSEARKRDFFARLESILWPALAEFHSELQFWQSTWASGTASPGMFMMAMTAKQTGMIMPPGVMTPPDTATVRACAEEVINKINRVFAGPGIPVARALAYDAMRILEILDEPTLPVQTGTGSKEQMLKSLGIAVGADVVRAESAITQFALAIMMLPKVSTGNDELAYLAQLFQLSQTIPWTTVGVRVTATRTSDPVKSPFRDGGNDL